jgi:pteridine reductase
MVSVMNTDTKNRVVLITGAARRIGACTARTFHGHGYCVLILCHQSTNAAHQLAAELNNIRADSATVLSADLNIEEQVQQLAAAAIAAYGRLDVLVNNASRFYATPLGKISQQNWQDLMASNAQAPLFLSQALAAELVKNNGSIVNLTDMNADRGMAGFVPYTMAKAALQAMTRSLARELAPAVRVNAVSPGAILWPEHASDPQLHAQQQASILSGIPLGRLGSEQDIANAVFFLANDAHYITGQILNVDGGRVLC